jgi:glycosyltransferase involved in cell wall biosynthesis
MHNPAKSPYCVSVVVPIHNEQECLPALARELSQVLDTLGCDFEIIFVDDASTDATPSLLAELCREGAVFKGVRFSRNFGHQAALSCGLSMARGDAVITMDGDFQHPPSLIPRMVELWYEQGYDVVNMVRRETQGSGWIDRHSSRWFYRLFNRIADIKLTPGSADFRLLDKRCVSALCSMGEYFKFLRGQVPYIGFRQTHEYFDCLPRRAGERSYTFKQSLRLASNGLLSFSTFGLKLPLLLGLGVLGLVGIYGLITAYLLASGKSHLIEGWLSIVALLCLSIGLQLTFMGMMGAYIGKIFIEVKGRPLYFVDHLYHEGLTDRRASRLRSNAGGTVLDSQARLASSGHFAEQGDPG